MCGLPGSGKTTYAKGLKNTARLTVDEEVFKRYGKEFNSELLAQYETEIKKEFKEAAKQRLQAGTSVALDYGFWKRSERDEYKQLAKSVDAEWRLIFFDAPLEVLKSRINTRNTAEPVHNHVISNELLESFVAQLEIPHGEGEEVIKN